MDKWKDDIYHLISTPLIQYVSRNKCCLVKNDVGQSRSSNIRRRNSYWLPELKPRTMYHPVLYHKLRCRHTSLTALCNCSLDSRICHFSRNIFYVTCQHISISIFYLSEIWRKYDENMKCRVSLETANQTIQMKIKLVQLCIAQLHQYNM